MANIVLHPATRAQIDLMCRDLPQSLLLSGKYGVGLAEAARYIAQTLGVTPLFVLPEKDEKVDIEKGTISVDVVRRLYATTKTVASQPRIIVIDYAERMGAQAQNAFLKLLEEPGHNTHFIILAHNTSQLLPTIRSRVQAVEVRTVRREDSEALLDTLGVNSPQKRSQLLFMAEGLPAELTRLFTDDTYFEARAQVLRDAKQYLEGSLYDRHTIAMRYKDSRQSALLLLEDAMKLIQRNVSQGKGQLIGTVDELLRAYEVISGNGNIRLQLAAVKL